MWDVHDVRHLMLEPSVLREHHRALLEEAAQWRLVNQALHSQRRMGTIPRVVAFAGTKLVRWGTWLQQEYGTTPNEQIGRSELCNEQS